jgi:hypothetical protein
MLRVWYRGGKIIRVSDLAIYHAGIDGLYFILAELKVEQKLERDEHLDPVETYHEKAPLPIVWIVVAIQIIQVRDNRS